MQISLCHMKELDSEVEECWHNEFHPPSLLSPAAGLDHLYVLQLKQNPTNAVDWQRKTDWTCTSPIQNWPKTSSRTFYYPFSICRQNKETEKFTYLQKIQRCAEISLSLLLYLILSPSSHSLFSICTFPWLESTRRWGIELEGEGCGWV